MSTTPHLGLALIASGTTNWAGTMDNNLSVIDTAVYALQEGGTTGPQGPAGAAGAVGMIFAGAWTASTAYIVTDTVTYNGGTYLAIAASTNAEPDINPNTWAPLALPGLAGPQGATGATGPQGATGPAGPPGTWSVPVPVNEGGTGATTATTALTNLGAAANGANNDITSLAAIPGTTINSTGYLLGVTDGAHNGVQLGFNLGSGSGGTLLLSGPGEGVTISAGGGITTNNVILTGSLFAPEQPAVLNAINPQTTLTVTSTDITTPPATLSINALSSTPQQGLLGFQNYPTHTTVGAAGAASALPATPALYLELLVNGTVYVLPLYAHP